MQIWFARCIRVLAMLAAWLVPATAMAQPSMAPSVPSLSNAQISRLEAGEVLVEVITGDVPVGDALGVINAPPERVLELIRDFDTHDEWMGDMAEAEVIERTDEYYMCRGETDTPWPMSNRSYTMRATAGPAQVDGVDVLLASWEYVPDSGNIVDSRGYWMMVPWGDDGQKTLLRYHLYVDLGTWLPDFLLEWSTENFLPIKVTDIRDRLGV